MIAYFDTQVFDHIYKKIGCASGDVANMRKAIYGRQLSIRLSIHTLAEILLGRIASPQAFTAQIKLTLSLASSRTLIKPCAQLVLDDVRSYAASGEAARPFLPGDSQNAVAEGLSTLIESDGEELEDDFLGVLQHAQREKQWFVDFARQGAEAFAKSTAGQDMSGQRIDAVAPPMLQGLAEHAGVSGRCRQRGLEGMLKIRSIKATIAAALGAGFAQQPTGVADLTASTVHHAVSAATVAEMYVTDTAQNRNPFAVYPAGDLDVITLPEFLKRL